MGALPGVKRNAAPAAPAASPREAGTRRGTGLRRGHIPDEAVSLLVDGVLGIVRDLRDATVEPNCPAIFVSGAESADTSPYFGVPCTESNSGAGLTRHAARLSAVGEAVERYASAAFDPALLRFGTRESLGEPALAPEAFELFHESQREALHRYARFGPDTPLAWVEGFSLTRRAPCWLPAATVFLPYFRAFEERGEAIICPSYSTGLSAGCTVPEALYYGLCEVIERDAFMAMWMNRLPLPSIDFSGDDALVRTYEEVFARDALEYVLLDATTDVGVPAVFCLILDHALSPPLVSIGGAARLSAAEAARKAMLEAAHTYQWARTLRRERKRYRADFADVVEFSDHVALHASGALHGSLDFLRENPVRRDLAAMPEMAPGSYVEAVRIITNRLEALGMEAFAVDLTTPDVGEIGFQVARALVPGLIPLHADNALKPLGHGRLYDIARRMGYDTRRRTIEEMNPIPHPFP